MAGLPRRVRTIGAYVDSLRKFIGTDLAIYSLEDKPVTLEQIEASLGVMDEYAVRKGEKPAGNLMIQSSDGGRKIRYRGYSPDGWVVIETVWAT